MFKNVNVIFLAMAFFAIACAEDNSDKQEEEIVTENLTEEELKSSEKVYDTVKVTTVFLKIVGKENLIQGPYTKDQNQTDFIRSQSEEGDFEKMVNVDVKGSPFANDNDEGYVQDESGTLKSKMVVYDMLEIDMKDIEQPFRVSVITHVKDFKAWKWLYDMEEQNRTNAGMRQVQLGLNSENKNEVFMLIAIEDIGVARELMEHPGLKKKMAQSGVIGEPEVKFWRPAGPQTEEL